LAIMVVSSTGGRQAVDPALDPPHDLDQDRAAGDDGEHADEHLVGLEARAGLADHGADARGEP
jgi:hypothetical protein